MVSSGKALGGLFASRLNLHTEINYGLFTQDGKVPLQNPEHCATSPAAVLWAMSSSLMGP